MIIQDRDSSRRVFVETWLKYRAGERMSALEQLVAGVILEHPEYHGWFDHPDILQQDFSLADAGQNPFLHMGLHIAVAEQVGADRPPGALSLFRALRGKYPDEHALYHRMMECLEESLRQAQQNGCLPDEQSYLECLRKLG